MSVQPVAMEPPEESRSASILAELRASGGAADSFADAGPVRSRRRVNIQTVVVVLVVAATGLALVLMRALARDNGRRLPPVPEAPTAKIQSRSLAEEKRILAELERSTNAIEIPPEQIGKNPFMLDTEAPVLAGMADADARRRAEREKADRERREEEMKTRLGQIVLTGIMEGPRPVAFVSGEMFRVGEKLQEYFTVTQIHDRSIDLLGDDGKTYTVRMNDGAVQPGGHKPTPRPSAPPAPR